MKIPFFKIYCVLVAISHYKFIAIIVNVIKTCSKKQMVHNKTFLFWESLYKLTGKIEGVLNRNGSTYWCVVLKILYLLLLQLLIIKLREIISCRNSAI